MIVFISGNNTFQSQAKIKELEQSLGVAPESFAATDLAASDLTDLLLGQTLFATKRLVVLKDSSLNSSLWDQLPDMLARLSESTAIVLREVKPDKRTRSYKAIAKLADEVVEARSWTERERRFAEKWTTGRARELGVSLSPQQINNIVQRSLIDGGKNSPRIVDQLMINGALELLADLGDASDQAIDTILPPALSDEIFSILDQSINRQTNNLHKSLSDLEVLYDGFQVMALVAKQWFQVVAIALRADGELAINPYVRGKLADLATRLTRSDIKFHTNRLTELDTATKTTSTTAWQALRLFLFELANR